MQRGLDFAGLAADLLSRADTLLPQWLPAGRWHGREYKVGSVKGEPGESLSINADTGLWKDFSGTDGGRDLIALYAAMHGLSQGDAAKELASDSDYRILPRDDRQPPPPPKPPAYQPTPPPSGALAILSPSDFKCGWGLPTKIYAYRNLDGVVMFYVARYEPKGERKQFIHWTWLDGWHMKAWPKPRVLYNLPALSSRPKDSPVLLVEGEKACDAASAMLGGYAVLSWAGGAASINTADWAALAGRKVDLWPDADEPGVRAMNAIAEVLVRLGCTVRMITPSDVPEGFDAADAMRDGWELPRLLDWARARLAPWSPQPAEAPAAAAEAAPAPKKPQRMRRSEPAEGPSGTLIDHQTGAPVEITPADMEAVSRHDSKAPVSCFQLWQDWGLRQSGARQTGDPLANLSNISKVLRNHPLYRTALTYDEFHQRLFLVREDGRRVEWSERDELDLVYYLEAELKIPSVRTATVAEAAMHAGMQNTSNEPREWLMSLEWDGEERLPRLIADYFKSDDSEYSSAVGRCFMVSMVARILQPGCKVDTMPIFEGPEGALKSTALQVIGGRWYGVSNTNVLDKDFLQNLAGKMLVEIAELHTFKAADVERVKGIVSTATDTYRQSYGRRSKDHPRQSVFAGTTNRSDWNSSDTGARRFWPVRCGQIDLEALRRDREQLFAEAVARYQRGEPWWDIPVEEAIERQEQRREHDAWTDPIANWVLVHPEVTVAEILAGPLELDKGRWGRSEQMRVSRILTQLGFEGRIERRGKATPKIYRRKSV